MTEFSHDAWVEEVVQHCARSNLVRVQLGAAYPHARTALTSRIGSEFDAAAYLEEASNGPGMRLVTNVEALITGAPLSLGRLRDRVNADRDNGAQIVLVSRLPKIGYPDVPGSSVLRDAKPIAPPLYTSDLGSNFVFGLEATSSGTPADVVLAQAFRELGEAACASLDAFLFERGGDAQSLDSLEEPVVDGLLSAGLATVVEGKLVWALTEPRERARSALAEVIASMRHPQKEFSSVAENSWAVERIVKQALRARAVTLWGPNWKNELIPPDSHGVILRRANTATYDPAETLDELRDPLEWMTLAETLDVRSVGDAGSLGLHDGMWTHFAAEMLPVKDRIDRSQLLRKHDADTAMRWSQVLRQKLSTTGSPDPIRSIGSSPVPQRELLKGLRAALLENSHVHGDVEKDVLALVQATVRFLVHTSDTPMAFTEEFSDRADAPMERALQESFAAFLDAGDLSGRSAVEVESVGAGRADVVLYMNDGARYVTEVKRHFSHSSRDRLENAYLAQALAYQAANVPFSQLLILDLSRNRAAHEDHLTNSVWVTHKRDSEEAVVASTVVAVVRGNRPKPSQRKM